MGLPFDTAGNIINQAAVELGLASVADPYASTDQNFIQLRTLLKSIGRDLRRRHQWTYLTQGYTFNTVAGQANYPLPVDYGAFIDGTGWNRTNRLPLGGPLSPQEFEAFRGSLSGVVFTVLFRTLQQQFQVFPDTNTPGNYIIAYEYVSRFWVVPAATQATTSFWSAGQAFTTNQYVTNGGSIWKCQAGGTSGTYGPVGTSGTVSDGVLSWVYVSAAGTDTPTASTDVIQLDSQLVSRALKLSFRLANGFDATAAQNDFETVLEQAINDDTVATTLNVGSTPAGTFLIGDGNLPITGYGS